MQSDESFSFSFHNAVESRFSEESLYSVKWNTNFCSCSEPNPNFKSVLIIMNVFQIDLGVKWWIYTASAPVDLKDLKPKGEE